jgi:hypothetical protein
MLALTSVYIFLMYKLMNTMIYAILDIAAPTNGEMHPLTAPPPPPPAPPPPPQLDDP